MSHPQTASLTLNGATLTVELTTLFQAWLEKAAHTAAPATHAATAPATAGFSTPALNDGELYAGIVCGEGGKPTHHLILLPGDGADIKWEQAKEWAATAGGELPTRLELAMLYANHKDAFEAAWYWSSEQHAADSDFVWGQLFNDGGQYDYRKSYEGRARAVRRLAISAFNDLGAPAPALLQKQA